MHRQPDLAPQRHAAPADGSFIRDLASAMAGLAFCAAAAFVLAIAFLPELPA